MLSFLSLPPQPKIFKEIDSLVYMAFTLPYTSVLTNIVAGILVIGFGILVGNILSVVLKKILQSFEVQRILEDFGLHFPLEEFLASLLKYGIYIAGLLLGLGFLGLDKIFLYAVLFIILGLFIAFILLSFKDIISDFIAGIFIFFKGKIRVGEIVEIDTVEGKVIHMDMMEAKIRTQNGDIVVIPNSLILRSVIIRKRK